MIRQWMLFLWKEFFMRYTGILSSLSSHSTSLKFIVKRDSREIECADEKVWNMCADRRNNHVLSSTL